MTSEERIELERIVRHEIEKITVKINEIRDYTVPVEPDCAIDDISRTEALNNQSIVEASMRNLQERKNQLKKTLQVIHEWDYGICTACLKPIPLERLKIRPEVRLCAGCI